MRFRNIAGVGGAGLANFGIGMARMWQRASPAERKNFPQWMQDMSEWGKKKAPPAAATPAATSVTPEAATPGETPATATPVKSNSVTPTSTDDGSPVKQAVDDSLKTDQLASNDYISTANELGMGEMPTTMPMGGVDLALQLPGEATNLGIGASA